MSEITIDKQHRWATYERNDWQEAFAGHSELHYHFPHVTIKDHIFRTDKNPGDLPGGLLARRDWLPFSAGDQIGSSPQ